MDHTEIFVVEAINVDICRREEMTCRVFIYLKHPSVLLPCHTGGVQAGTPVFKRAWDGMNTKYERDE